MLWVKNHARAAALGLGIAVAAAGHAAVVMPISPQQIDDVAARAMKSFHVPGIAIGIVKDGKLVFAKGYGVRQLGAAGKVDPHTVFQIGSNSKAFTAAALAMMVDEGKLQWDDKVIDYLPQFRLYDPYVTREFTIRDLLTHRSGLGPGAGDLMFYPETDFSRAEIIRGLRHLKPVAGFRAAYGYDNILYMIAGELIPVLANMPWEDFVEQKIFRPLGMGDCAASHDRIRTGANLAAPHTMVDGVLTNIPVENITVIGAAGTINCSVDAMTKWLMVQLAEGGMANGKRLFSADRSQEMWTVNTAQQVDALSASLTRAHFKGYGLGWELQDEFGYKRVMHTGGVPGTSTWVTMIPELQLGIVVLTNVDSNGAMEAVGHRILDAYVGAPKRDFVAILQAALNAGSAAAAAAVAEATSVGAAAPVAPLALSLYAGHYIDQWRGAADIRRDGEALVLKFSRTSKLEGRLTPLAGNVFIVHWNDRSLNADAYVRFSQTFDGHIEGMTLRAISPETDFSFDFQDLTFEKQGDGR
jgi:CubicO group peptidase (beta-lactamase class C family)